MLKRPCDHVAYEPPAYALRVLEVLEGAGYEAWIVGGWVRDALMGAPCHDVDVTTDALWEQSEEAFRAAGYPVIESGAQHGTVTVVIDGQPVEVTTYRHDGTYTDHRHPDEVEFVHDVCVDLLRRDFTVNAIAYHPQRGILDPYGGCADLAAGIIRTVGNPYRRFSEDALRVLRAVRFACRMGFDIEPRTHQALKECAHGIEDLAQERIGQEMCGILETGRVGWALRHEPDVLCNAIPELTDMLGFDQKSPWHAYDVMEHTVRVCNAVEAFTAGVASLRLRWAALLHDIGKPATLSLDEQGGGHFYGHPILGAIMAERIMKRLALPSDLVRSACALVRYHDHIVRPTARSMRRTLAMLEEADPGNAMPLSHELMDLKRADAVSKVPKAAWYAIDLDEMDKLLVEEERKGVVLHVRDLKVTGRDVVEALGIKPGPMVGMTLSSLLGSVIDGDIENTHKALMSELYRLSMDYS